MQKQAPLKTHPDEVPSLQDPNTARSLYSESVREQLPSEKIRRMHIRHTAFAVLACAVSPTSLGLIGYCVALTGIIGFIFVTFLSYFVNFFTLQLLIRAQEIKQANSFDDIGKRLFGKKMKISILAVSTVCLVGVSISCIVYLKNVIVGIILSFSNDVPTFLTNTTFWAFIFCEGVILPLTCMPRLKGVSYISSFSSVLPFLLLILSIPHYLINRNESRESSKLLILSNDPKNYLESFSLLVYPMMVHPNFLTIFTELINPTHKRKLQTLFIGFLPMLIVYTAIAYLNFFHFSSNIDTLLQQQNIFQISSYIKWVPMRVMSILFLISPITMAISMNITLKVQAIDLWCKTSRKYCFWNLVISFILCQIIMIPSVFLNQIALAIRLVSATFYPVICYVLPGIFYYKAQKQKTCQKKSIKCLGVIMSVIFVLFSLYGAVDIGSKLFQ